MKHDESKSPEVSRRDFLSSTGKVAAASLFTGTARLEEQPETPQKATDYPSNCPQPEDEPQYKRLCKNQMARIEDGDIAGAIQCLSRYLEASPLDTEYMYGLVVAYTMSGNLDEAIKYVQRALDGGMSISRFLAGPRQFLSPLYAHKEFSSLARAYGNELIHGPLLGSVTDTSARFWARTVHQSSLRVLIATSDDMTNPTYSETTSTVDANDFTGIVEHQNLAPDTQYYYQIELNGEIDNQIYSFKTFPSQGQPAQFSIGFGGCAGYTPWHEHIWRLIADYDLPLFLLTGDNIYIDDPTRQGVQDYVYYRRQSRPEFRELVSGTSIAAIWDDHEFGDDDSWGGPDIETPAWKLPVWRTFKNNWNNPSYGDGIEQPGCWFSFSIADVDIFMLDDRFYRDNHREPPADRPATMLGPQQKKWLLEELTQSQATFKVIVTSVPWAYGVKPGSNDPWQGFKAEREEIFSFLSNKKIDGVFLLSGDRHRADIWKIEREEGYPMFDFENARLTNIHTHNLIPGAIFGYNEKCTFGRLRFDTTQDDPEVIYDIISIDNELILSFPLRLSQISH